MDKEHAKFILQSYRPDGADAQDPHFKEALTLAAEDRELGEWLAHERAHDSVFTEALNAINIPEGLRTEILSVLENDQSGGEDLDFDSDFFGAMASLQPPAGLRDQILSSMEVEKSNSAEQKTIQFPKKWAGLSAIAAALVVGFITYSQFSPNVETDTPTIVADVKVDLEPLNLHSVQLQTGSFIKASNAVEYNNDSLEDVNQWLVSNGLPEASNVPTGLVQSKTKGSRKVVFDNGLEASMVQFDKKGMDEIYLMVLDANSVENVDQIVNIDGVNLMQCKTCPMSHFNITSWKDTDQVYMLLTMAEASDLVELF